MGRAAAVRREGGRGADGVPSLFALAGGRARDFGIIVDISGGRTRSRIIIKRSIYCTGGESAAPCRSGAQAVYYYILYYSFSIGSHARKVVAVPYRSYKRRR